MAFKRKEENKKEFFDLAGYKATVQNVRIITEHFISFTLRCAGFSLYNMKLVERADGKYFIAPPSQKAKNGNFYDLYAVYLTEEDEKRLIEKVLELADND